jgi:RNA polymerase sigma-70 factor (ECF subfamily)
MTVPSDADLVQSARAGDAAALGALVMRHRADMHAVAIGALGYGPEAEDAVQDGIVSALASLGDLRDPAVAGAWLRAIVRNHCLMILRRRRADTAFPAALESLVDSPEDVLERRALRAWTFRALDSLSEPLQLTLLLRYFTDVTAYEDIAAFLAVPVGTVRSRLAEAKRKLAHELLSEASARFPDIRERTARHTSTVVQVLAEAERGRFSHASAAIFEPDLAVVGPSREWGTDLGFLTHVLESDRERGVCHVLRNVVCGSRITIWEMNLVSPAGHPRPCPPSIVWLHSMKDGRTRRLRLQYWPR